MRQALAASLVLGAAVLLLWSRREPPALPQAEVLPTPLPAKPPLPVFPSPAPPTSSEVVAAVDRVLKGAARIAGSARPLTGDFNGDGSMDLAVVVRPDPASLRELNSSLANWTVEAPLLPPLRDPARPAAALTMRPARVEIGSEDPLLAVIHGFGEPGWRNPAARQTYLLVGVVGRGMTTAPLKERLAGVRVTRSRADLLGDGIVDTLPMARGFLYWDGARYAWLPEARVGGGAGR